MMQRLLKASVVAVFLAQSCLVALGQSASQDGVIRTTSNLVLVDVVVTSKDKPVRGLERTRFHILDSGKAQPIVSFDEHAPGEKSSATDVPAIFADASAPHTYTNLSPYPAASAVNVLLLDALNTPVANQIDVRRRMVEYLGGIEPGTSLAIFTLSSRLRLVEGFTTDAAQLARAMKSSATNPNTSALLDPAADQAFDTAIGEMANMGVSRVNPQSNLTDPIAAMQQFQADGTAYETDQRVRLTLEALQQLARYLSGIPGRKNLIWFSGSFPLTLDPNDSLQSPFAAMRNYSDQLQETSRLLSQARVAVYPVDASALATPKQFDASYTPSTNLVGANTGSGRGSARARNQANLSNLGSDNLKLLKQNMQEEATLNQIAAETGGKAYMWTNGLSEAVADAVQIGSTYYTIGFSPAALDGQFHKIEIRLDNSADKLAYRSGYFAGVPAHSSALNPEVSLVAATSMHGAPASSEVLFQARVLDAADPGLKGSRLPEGPAGDMAASIGQPARRVIVDVKVDPEKLALERTLAGARTGKIEFVLIAYDAEGKRVNYLDRGFQMSLSPDQYAGVLKNGIPIRLALDLPPHRVFLRIAVHDLTAGRVGSLEIPYMPPPAPQ